ncbi:MAG: hypothetical protein JL50_08240 [Peptococcaceae bacterium BICA1-7]|nr:MAG: hypothetical protein JL50_08240 [Peptococcaceae bacterium BICA1-7]HBV97450.1 hypothetical protein [Desulfotomaculum sp.]
MRDNGFLRTPIRADQQAQLQGLQVHEQPLLGDPKPGDPYPQTLVITFTSPAGGPDVQIAPLWEGALYFLADSTAGLPTRPADAVEAKFSSWTLVGDLVLITPQGLENAFRNHIPLITPPPGSVRYSKVRLTREFLFTTLKRLRKFTFAFQGQATTSNEHAKCLVGFLQGRTGVLCAVDARDPGQDNAQLDMPVVYSAGGGTATLRVTASSLIPEINKAHWFDQCPDYDDLAGETLVPAGLAQPEFQRFHPCHPSHSVVSLLALFQTAAASVYAPDHGVSTPLRTLMSAPLQGGKVYRRLTVRRPPIPGVITSSPNRSFPSYQLVLQGAGETGSLRIPLSGRMYLPLADGPYLIFAIPRSLDPQNGIAGQPFPLSLDHSTQGKRYLDFPTPTVTVDLAAGQTDVTIYAHLREYDSRRAWKVFRDLTARQRALRRTLGVRWNVGPMDQPNVQTTMAWYVPTQDPVNIDYAAVYGYIREAAGRHGLSPEFLHAVLMGEGVSGGNLSLLYINLHHVPPIRYDDTNQNFNSFSYLGLDDIWLEVDTLIAENYVDPRFKAQMTALPQIPHELNDLVTPAIIKGWEAAVELMAADLHWRQDLGTAYCQNHVPAISCRTELRRRYLTYVHFNTGQPWQPDSGQRRAERRLNLIESQCSPWPSTEPRPSGPGDARFNSLVRVATAAWYDQIQVYR